MSVYVDPLMEYGGSDEFRWTRSCHLYADTVAELHRFAARIGMRRAWFQNDRRLPHYDLTEKRRVHAVKLGAKERSLRQLVVFLRCWRKNHTASLVK
jgi:hypothetical protein